VKAKEQIDYCSWIQIQHKIVRHAISQLISNTKIQKWAV